MKTKRGGYRPLLLYLSGIAIYLLTFKLYLVPSTVQGESMLPSYQDNTCGYVLKPALADLQRGAVIAFEVDIGDGKEKLLKRLIGLPGDVIEIQNNCLFVNEQLQAEHYLYEPMFTEDLQVTVPEGSVFVLGDNRNVSLDSRYADIGCVPLDAVCGRFFGTPYILYVLPVFIFYSIVVVYVLSFLPYSNR